MSTHQIAHLRTILKKNGHQITTTRETMFRILLNSEPQTMNEIILKAHGIVDRVSVYRNIDLFERLGIVHRVYIGWKYKIELTDAFTEHHHHLSCLSCGKIIDIQDHGDIDDFIKKITLKYNFMPRRHQFEIDGTCPDCQLAVS